MLDTEPMKVIGYFSYFGSLWMVGLDYRAAGSPHQQRELAISQRRFTNAGCWLEDGAEEGLSHDARTSGEVAQAQLQVFDSRGESTVVSLLR